MERDFEEIEIDCLPGALFFGSVDFGVDGDAPCVERILLQAWSRQPCPSPSTPSATVATRGFGRRGSGIGEIAIT